MIIIHLLLVIYQTSLFTSFLLSLSHVFYSVFIIIVGFQVVIVLGGFSNEVFRGIFGLHDNRKHVMIIFCTKVLSISTLSDITFNIFYRIEISITSIHFCIT